MEELSVNCVFNSFYLQLFLCHCGEAAVLQASLLEASVLRLEVFRVDVWRRGAVQELTL